MDDASLVFIVEGNSKLRGDFSLALESGGLATRAWADAETFLREHGRDRQGGGCCLLSGVHLPCMSGLELQWRLIEHRIQIPIVFVTAHADVATSVTALKRGAADFLELPCSDRALLQSVGEALSTDRMTRQAQRERSVVNARCARLTERELRVMAMVIGNRSNKEIARTLAISPRTVDHHREHVMAKMEATSIGDLVVMGLLCGLKELRLHTDHASLHAA